MRIPVCALLLALAACHTARQETPREAAPAQRVFKFDDSLEEFELYEIGDRVQRGELRYEVLSAYYVEAEDGGTGHVCVQLRITNTSRDARYQPWEFKFPGLCNSKRRYNIDKPVFDALALRDFDFRESGYLEPGKSLVLVFPFQAPQGSYALCVANQRWSHLPQSGGRGFFFDLGEVGTESVH